MTNEAVATRVLLISRGGGAVGRPPRRCAMTSFKRSPVVFQGTSFDATM
jgi:hypothetical protein